MLFLARLEMQLAVHFSSAVGLPPCMKFSIPMLRRWKASMIEICIEGKVWWESAHLGIALLSRLEDGMWSCGSRTQRVSV